MANEIFTRIQLKYDSYANWTTNNPTLLAGEIAIAKLVNDVTVPVDASKNAPVLFKVGPGAFNDLPWASALAADVYGWAKQENLPVVRNDAEGQTEGNVISSISWDEDTGSIKYTTASVATSEGMAELQQAVDAIEKDIEDNRAAWLEKTVDTNDNTTYAFAIVDGKLQVTETPSVLGVAGEPVVTTYDFVTPDELTTVLASYYTSAQVDALVDGKLHTQSEIEGYIDSALAKVSDTDTIEGITTLVEYVNTHGTDLAAITKEIYGDSGKVGDDPSRIDTAIADSAQAKSDASEAKANAAEALTKAGEALEGAEGAAASATAAKASEDNAKASENAAKSSENAAGASASEAAASAGEATTQAGLASEAAGFASSAQAAADGAKEGAEAAQSKAEEAQGKAETAKGEAEQARDDARSALLEAAGARDLASEYATAAETAKGKAEDAQAAAEQAKSDAETAKQAAEAAKAAAEASNTSATAIANEAKETANAAKTASEAATEAVAGLHAIATSGSIYDVEEGSTVSTGTDNTQKYLIFNCGTSTTVL